MHWTITTVGVNLSVIMCPVPKIVLIEDIWNFFLMNGQISLIRPIFLSWWLISKEFACNAGDLGLIPGSGRSFGEGNGNPLQYSCLENPIDPIDRGAWWPWGHKESDTTMQLNSNRRPIFTFQPLFHPRAISILGKGPPEKEISHKFFFQ